jgi:hypothetical protein
MSERIQEIRDEIKRIENADGVLFWSLLKVAKKAADLLDTLEREMHEHENWTPIEKGLPKKDGIYDVTVKSAFGKLMLLPGYLRDGEWVNCAYYEHIIAWKPKPDPYNPDQFREPTEMMQEGTNG